MFLLFDFYIDGFKGDIVLWCKLLLPGAVKRIYNLQSKQLIKLFARLLLQDEDAMLEHLEQGDVAETISVFFENSVSVSPCTASVLTIQDVSLILQINMNMIHCGTDYIDQKIDFSIKSRIIK